MENGLDLSVGYALKRAQHALRLRVDEVLREAGLTTPQYAVLSVLEDAPGLSGAELARRSFVTPQTMNAIVTKLEASGMIWRRPHPEQGRVLQAYLTEKGRNLAVDARAAVEEVEERMLAGLSPEERGRLLEMLRACTNSLEAMATGGGSDRDGTTPA